MIKTAVILAAGMGKRIRDKSGDRPKGFLTLMKNQWFNIQLKNY